MTLEKLTARVTNAARRGLVIGSILVATLVVARSAAAANAQHPPGIPADVCSAQVWDAALRHGVPAQLAVAISAHESGLSALALGLNSGSAHNRTKAQAIARIKRALKAGGPVSVGCMQINLLVHRADFANPVDALDPAKNADWAAAHLARLKKQTGSWERAVERYHGAANPTWNAGYRCQVAATLERLFPDTPVRLRHGKECSRAVAALVEGYRHVSKMMASGQARQHFSGDLRVSGHPRAKRLKVAVRDRAIRARHDPLLTHVEPTVTSQFRRQNIGFCASGMSRIECRPRVPVVAGRGGKPLGGITEQDGGQTALFLRVKVLPSAIRSSRCGPPASGRPVRCLSPNGVGVPEA